MASADRANPHVRAYNHADVHPDVNTHSDAHTYPDGDGHSHTHVYTDSMFGMPGVSGMCGARDNSC